MRYVMAILGFVVSFFIMTRVHMKTRLGLAGALIVTALILILFTYLSTYYVPPESLEGSEALARVAEMNSRRLFLIVGEIAGLAAYLFRTFRRG